MIVTLTGPSGVGKGYLTAQIKNVLGAEIIPWTTTRKARADDSTTNNRRFVSLDHFRTMESAGLLIGVQNLHGEKYGLERHLVDKLDPEKIYICEVNSAHILSMFPFINGRFSLALVTNNFQLLRERIRSRESNINDSELESRLAIATQEVAIINSNNPMFDLKVNIDEYNESGIATLVIKAIQKGIKNGT